MLPDGRFIADVIERQPIRHLVRTIANHLYPFEKRILAADS
jgi:hypothetical protein